MRKSHVVRGLFFSAAIFGTVATMPTAAEAQARRDIAVANGCNQPIRFFVHHADGYRNWHPHGWWDFRPNQQMTRLRVGSNMLTQLEDHDLYIYGRTTSGDSQVWEGGGPEVRYEGATYRMFPLTVTVASNGELQARLTCSGGK